MSTAEEALARAEQLLEELNSRRDDLEQLASAEEIDADAAVDTIASLSELAKQIEAELARARTISDSGSDASHDAGADAGQ